MADNQTHLVFVEWEDEADIIEVKQKSPIRVSYLRDAFQAKHLSTSTTTTDIQVYDKKDGTKLHPFKELGELGTAEDSALFIKVQAQPAVEAQPALRPSWDLNRTGSHYLNRRYQVSEGQPKQLLGRDEACKAVKDIAISNCKNRISTDHATFSFLIAAGHVRSGKTRMGIETPRLVEEVCKTDPRLRNLSILPPVYLKMDFLNGCKYDATFDTPGLSPSLSLVARLMYAYYGPPPAMERTTQVLKDIPHDQAILHIISKELDNNPGEGNIVPVVCHFDEHGDFTGKVSGGKTHFIDMLREIGSTVTSSDSLLRQKKLGLQYFIVPITTGTSKREANIGGVSTYRVQSVPLPVLSFGDTKKLARAFFSLADGVEKDIDIELEQMPLQIGLADTGGLPGLIGMVCEDGICPAGDYSLRLQTKITSYTATSTDWSGRWPKLATVALARPTVTEGTIINGDYTVSKAQDSGTILFSDQEIGVAPPLFRSFNHTIQFVNFLLLKHITKMEVWTWQDFGKAHALYLSAVMAALIKEQSRFLPSVTLRNLL